jgi:membrane protein required for colicin V production
MNLLDLIIISILIFLVVKGLLRGFVRELASLAGVILGILLGNHFQPGMTLYLKSYLPLTDYLPLISFASLFALILIACNLMGYLLKLLFSKVFLGWLDRTLGVGLALAKGVILIYLVIVILVFFVPTKAPLIAQSKLGPWIIVSYQSMVKFISPAQYENWKKRLLGEEKGTGK